MIPSAVVTDFSSFLVFSDFLPVQTMVRDPVQVLPRELVLSVCDNLSLKPDLLRASIVSREWRAAIATHPTFWRDVNITVGVETDEDELLADYAIPLACAQLAHAPVDTRDLSVSLQTRRNGASVLMAQSLSSFVTRHLRPALPRVRRLAVRHSELVLDSVLKAFSASKPLLSLLDLDLDTGTEVAWLQDGLEERLETAARWDLRHPRAGVVSNKRHWFSGRHTLPRFLNAAVPNLQRLRLWYIEIPVLNGVFSHLHEFWATDCRGPGLLPRHLKGAFPHIEVLGMVESAHDDSEPHDMDLDEPELLHWGHQLHTVYFDSRSQLNAVRGHVQHITLADRLEYQSRELFEWFFLYLERWRQSLLEPTGGLHFNLKRFDEDFKKYPSDATSWRLSLRDPMSGFSCGLRVVPKEDYLHLYAKSAIPLHKFLPGFAPHITQLSVPETHLTTTIRGFLGIFDARFLEPGDLGGMNDLGPRWDALSHLRTLEIQLGQGPHAALEVGSGTSLVRTKLPRLEVIRLVHVTDGRGLPTRLEGALLYAHFCKSGQYVFRQDRVRICLKGVVLTGPGKDGWPLDATSVTFAELSKLAVTTNFARTASSQ